MWDLPRPGLEPVSPALAGGFLATVPPGKPVGFSDEKYEDNLFENPMYLFASLLQFSGFTLSFESLL